MKADREEAGRDPHGGGPAGVRDLQRRGAEAEPDPHGGGCEAGGDPRRRGRAAACASCGRRVSARPSTCRRRVRRKAIEKAFAAIKSGRPTPEMLAYQYLQTLPKMAEGDANKVWIVPSDFGKALEGLHRRCSVPPAVTGCSGSSPRLRRTRSRGRRTTTRRSRTGSTRRRIRRSPVWWRTRRRRRVPRSHRRTCRARRHPRCLHRRRVSSRRACPTSSPPVRVGSGCLGAATGRAAERACPGRTSGRRGCWSGRAPANGRPPRGAEPGATAAGGAYSAPTARPESATRRVAHNAGRSIGSPDPCRPRERRAHPSAGHPPRRRGFRHRRARQPRPPGLPVAAPVPRLTGVCGTPRLTGGAVPRPTGDEAPLGLGVRAGGHARGGHRPGIDHRVRSAIGAAFDRGHRVGFPAGGIQSHEWTGPRRAAESSGSVSGIWRIAWVRTSELPGRPDRGRRSPSGVAPLDRCNTNRPADRRRSAATCGRGSRRCRRRRSTGSAVPAPAGPPPDRTGRRRPRRTGRRREHRGGHVGDVEREHGGIRGHGAAGVHQRGLLDVDPRRSALEGVVHGEPLEHRHAGDRPGRGVAAVPGRHRQVEDVRGGGNGRVGGGVDLCDPLPDVDVLHEVQRDDGRGEGGTEGRHAQAPGR